MSENRVFAQQLAVAKSTLWARVEREVRMPQPAAKSQTKNKRRQAHVFFLPLSENMPVPPFAPPLDTDKLTLWYSPYGPLLAHDQFRHRRARDTGKRVSKCGNHHPLTTPSRRFPSRTSFMVGARGVCVCC